MRAARMLGLIAAAGLVGGLPVAGPWLPSSVRRSLRRLEREPDPDTEDTEEVPARVVQAEAKRARRRARNLMREGVR